jgi:hypothetical protein
MKRLRRTIAAAGLAALLAFPAAARADTGVQVLLDGQPLTFDVPAQIMNARTMVPFRGIAQALGATVEYDTATRTIHAVGLGHQVTLTVGSTVAQVDGRQLDAMDVPPQVINGRTLVPLRFFANAFGAGVSYDGGTRTVHISRPVWQPANLAFYAIQAFPERHMIPRFHQVAFGWGVLTPAGQVDFANSRDYHWPEPAGDITPESILADARAAGVTPLLMLQLTDRTGDLTRLVLRPDLRAAAAQNVAAAAAARGFAGVVLDLEGLGLTETGADLADIRAGFTDLVRQTAQRLHAQGRTLVVALPPPNGAYRGYDLPAVAAQADLVEIMAHDYRQDGQPEPLDLVEQAVEQTLAQVPAHKVLLGINLPVENAASLVGKVEVARSHWLKGLAFWRLGLMGPDRFDSLQAQGVLRP